MSTRGPTSKGDVANQNSARLFDLSCLVQLEIPPVWANSRSDLDAAAWTSHGRGQQHDALDGVALTVRNSHQINPHLPCAMPGRAAPDYRGQYLAKECVGSNRVLTRTIATSRSEATTTESSRQQDTNLERIITAPKELEDDTTYARRYPYGATQKKTVPT